MPLDEEYTPEYSDTVRVSDVDGGVEYMDGEPLTQGPTWPGVFCLWGGTCTINDNTGRCVSCNQAKPYQPRANTEPMQRFRYTVASKLQNREIVVTHGLYCIIKDVERSLWGTDDLPVTHCSAPVINTKRDVIEECDVPWGWLFMDGETAPHWTVQSNDRHSWLVLVYGPDEA
jgi:hypothetical protein